MKTKKDKPVPDVPVPRENQTGDLKWAEENIYGHDMFVKGFLWFALNIFLFVIVINGIILAICFSV